MKFLLAVILIPVFALAEQPSVKINPAQQSDPSVPADPSQQPVVCKFTYEIGHNSGIAAGYRGGPNYLGPKSSNSTVCDIGDTPGYQGALLCSQVFQSGEPRTYGNMTASPSGSNCEIQVTLVSPRTVPPKNAQTGSVER